MVDPIKGCTEINLHDPSFLPSLQYPLSNAISFDWNIINAGKIFSCRFENVCDILYSLAPIFDTFSGH